MANEEHLKILNQRVEAWNEWRDKNPQITPDLSKANLIMADALDLGSSVERRVGSSPSSRTILKRKL